MTDLVADDVARLFVEYVREDSGIQLDDYDVSVTLDGLSASVAVHGETLAEVEADEPPEDARDVAAALLEAVGDVRAALVTQRRRALEGRVDTITGVVRSALLGHGVPEDVVRGLEFAVGEAAHAGDAYDWADGDGASGYPAFELTVTGTSGIDVRAPLDATAPDEPCDLDDLAERLRDALGEVT